MLYDTTTSPHHHIPMHTNIVNLISFHFISFITQEGFQLRASFPRAVLYPTYTSTTLVPNIPPNLIIPNMCVHIRLIPLLRRTNTTVRKVTRLGRLTVRLDAAALVERDLAVVACARGGRAVFYLGAGEFAFDVGGVDAGFGCC